MRRERVAGIAGRGAGHGRSRGARPTGSGRRITGFLRKQQEVLEVVWSRFNGVDRENHARRAVANLAAVAPDRRSLKKTC